MKINKKGFTLIELLVVIAIIGILAGIVLVSLSGVRDRATLSSLKSTMASSATIASLCAMEGGDVSGYATGGATQICSLADITGTWQDLPANVSNEYTIVYAANTDMMIGRTTDAAADDVVCCDLETGSCTDAPATGCPAAAAL